MHIPKKISAYALAALALVGPLLLMVVHKIHGSDHRAQEAILPTQADGHDDDPAGTAVPDLREPRAIAETSATAAPFVQNDWPLPIARPYPNHLRTWLQGPSLALTADRDPVDPHTGLGSYFAPL